MLSSLSSNTKQLRARGNVEPKGKRSWTAALKWPRTVDKDSLWEHVATPITPKGKSDGLKRVSGDTELGKGCDRYER